jgi:hypothetical protein
MDVAVLGVRSILLVGNLADQTFVQAMQVSQAGDIANFMIPGKLVKGTWIGDWCRVNVVLRYTCRYRWSHGPRIKS